jgi:hypothetical protein
MGVDFAGGSTTLYGQSVAARKKLEDGAIAKGHAFDTRLVLFL